MRKQRLAILSIIALGTLFSVVYASGTIISNTGITTPTLTATTVTVTGSCTGCAGEGDFTNWTLSRNTTVTGTTGTVPRDIHVSNTGSVFMVDFFSSCAITETNGTTVFEDNNCSDPNNTPQIDQSATGEYRIAYIEYGGTPTLKVFKNDVLIKNITIGTGFVDNALSVAISPNGKYIAFFNSDTGSAINRVEIYEGS